MNLNDHPETENQWREHVIMRTGDLCEKHEIRLLTVLQPVDGEPLTLRFMSVHQSDTDLDEIWRRFHAALPAHYAQHLVDVHRNQIGEHSPPHLDITLTEPVPQGNTLEHTWTQWAAGCTVLAEFGLLIEAVRADSTGRQLDIVLVTPGRILDVDDLRGNLPRITMRLNDTSYEGARAAILASDGPANQAVLALRLDRSADDFDPPVDAPMVQTEPGEIPDTPPRRRNWQIALDKALVRGYRGWRGQDAELPEGYPANVHRAAAAFGLALAAAGVATVAAMGVVGLLGVLARALGHTGSMIASGEPARIVLGPVRAYTDAFLTAPRFTGSGFGLWALTGAVCFLLGWIGRNTGARIGWCLFGAATAWMAWRGTPTGAQQIALAVTAMWWILGSLLVFRRDTATPHVVAHVPGVDVDDRGHLTVRRHVSRALRQALATTRDLTRHAEQEPARPGTDVAIEHNHNGYAVTLTPAAVADPWEQMLTDAGVDGMVLLHPPIPLPAGQGFRLHMALPVVEPGSTTSVRTLSSVRAAIPSLEVLLGQRCPHLFDSGTVAPGAIAVDHATNGAGTRISGEVIITVFTGEILEPTPERIKPAVIDIARAAGLDGITPAALLDALVARGFRTLTAVQLTNLLMAMRTSPGDLPRVVSASGLITVDPDMRD